MVRITLIPVAEFQRVRQAEFEKHQRIAIIADMCRANTLAMVKRAGSGHLGSSFSAMDIVAWLYYAEMNTVAAGLDNPERDIYFSSKGHDVPGLYAVLFALEVIPKDRFLKLRRFGGLDGHPDIGTPGIESNSGSLGMGISKGKGMALAKRMLGHGGQVFVLTGDGELQEGQNYEALQSAAQQRVGNLNVIVDYNKVQTDKLVSEIVTLGDLQLKLEAFGWHVARCGGHDMHEIERALAGFRTIADRPKVLIADTVKGRGVSFMEHPVALQSGRGLYPWHAGAPDDGSFEAAHQELLMRINASLAEVGLGPIATEEVEAEGKNAPTAEHLIGEQLSLATQIKATPGASAEYVSAAYGAALVEMAERRQDIVVIDGDLAADCRVRDFERRFPERFIENGIAEQDMVSTAGGLARMGLLPVVNSFASFLASRANEQIYNNASEKTKIIYALHYAGLVPAGPGKSHQSLRDISLLCALPNCIILQPCNSAETRMVVEYCVQEARENCAIRLAIGPSPRRISLPPDYRLRPGRGVALTEGHDAIMFAYGPVMLHEALLASEALATRGLGLQVVNMPWLNRVDGKWLRAAVGTCGTVCVLEDHAPAGGLADHLSSAYTESPARQEHVRFHKFAVEGYPACGTPAEALRHHGLGGADLAQRILQLCEGSR